MWKPHCACFRCSIFSFVSHIVFRYTTALALSALSVVLARSSAHTAHNAVASTLYGYRLPQEKSVIEHWFVEEKLYRPYGAAAVQCVDIYSLWGQ